MAERIRLPEWRRGQKRSARSAFLPGLEYAGYIIPDPAVDYVVEPVAAEVPDPEADSRADYGPHDGPSAGDHAADRRSELRARDHAPQDRSGHSRGDTDGGVPNANRDGL